MNCRNSVLKLPLSETIVEVSRLMLISDASNQMLSRYGLGSKKKLNVVRRRLKDIGLTVRQIEAMDRHSLWELIFSKKQLQSSSCTEVAMRDPKLHIDQSARQL